LVLSSKNGLDSEGQDRPARNNLAFTGSCQTFPGFAGILISSPEEFASEDCGSSPTVRLVIPHIFAVARGFFRRIVRRIVRRIAAPWI
jgi:hypothetical protein